MRTGSLDTTLRDQSAAAHHSLTHTSEAGPQEMSLRRMLPGAWNILGPRAGTVAVNALHTRLFLARYTLRYNMPSRLLPNASSQQLYPRCACSVAAAPPPSCLWANRRRLAVLGGRRVSVDATEGASGNPRARARRREALPDASVFFLLWNDGSASACCSCTPYTLLRNMNKMFWSAAELAAG
jgi:hypothetical protein